MLETLQTLFLREQHLMIKKEGLHAEITVVSKNRKKVSQLLPIDHHLQAGMVCDCIMFCSNKLFHKK